MVVEDHPDIRELTVAALRDEGYLVVAVAEYSEAITHLAAFRFGLILADSAGVVTEPWRSLEALRNAAGLTPVVIYTAHSPARFAGYAERGFAGFLAKPFDLDNLLAIVREHLPAPAMDATSDGTFLTA